MIEWVWSTIINKDGKMRLKILILGFFLLYVCCSSNPERDPEIVAQQVNFYHDYSFTAIWTAAESSFDDINFVVTEKIREKGLYDAEGEPQPPQISPPLMSVMIMEEVDRIKVDCIVVLTGSDVAPELSSEYVTQFFNALTRNLER
jgi:hypothetical protein